MTIASPLDGIHRAEALLGYAATRLAGNPAVATDLVSLSDTALAMIQARIGLSGNITASHAVVKIQKALIDVMA